MLHAAKRFTGAEVRQLFARFVEGRLYRRHLRRAETFEDIIALDRVELPLTHEKRQALQ